MQFNIFFEKPLPCRDCNSDRPNNDERSKLFGKHFAARLETKNYDPLGLMIPNGESSNRNDIHCTKVVNQQQDHTLRL